MSINSTLKREFIIEYTEKGEKQITTVMAKSLKEARRRFQKNPQESHHHQDPEMKGKSRYQKYREAGLCGRCGKRKPVKGKARCSECLEESLRHHAEWAARNKEKDARRKREWAAKQRAKKKDQNQ